MNKAVKIILAVGGAAGLVAAGMVAANAGVPGSTNCKTLAYPLCDKSVAAKQVVNGTQNEIKMDESTRAKLQLGVGGPSYAIAETKIAKIGGSFAANATDLGTFELPAGTWDIDLSGKFDREDAIKDGEPNPAYVLPTTDLMPSLVIRYGTGKDAGTIMGAAISRAGYVELTGAANKRIKLTASTVFTVSGFGYNENRSAEGANQITVSGEVTTTRVG